MPGIYRILAAFLWLIPVIAICETLPAPVSLEVNGFHYVYKGIPVIDGLDGTLEITSKAGLLVYKTSGLPPPGCVDSKFDKPQILSIQSTYRKKEENIIALCGSYEGHHPTLMLFRGARLAAKLDFGAATPSLSWNANSKSYIAVAYYRLPNRHGSLDTFMRVYEWNPEGLASNGFYPIFNSHSYVHYHDYYVALKQTAGLEHERYLPILAALISTSNAPFICTELRAPTFSSINQTEIKALLSFNEKYGFPSFNTAVCNRGIANSD